MDKSFLRSHEKTSDKNVSGKDQEPPKLNYLKQKCTKENQTEEEKQEESDIKNDPWSCEYCKKSFEPGSFLKHVGKSKDCKFFYGTRFDDMKRDHRRQRKRLQRKAEKEEKEKLKRQESEDEEEELYFPLFGKMMKIKELRKFRQN